MRKALIVIAVVLGLVIVLLLVAPLFIPMDTYKGQISKAVEDATGREFAIRGALALSLFPRVGVEVNDVTFANAPGSSEPHMLTLKQLDVRLKTVPLLRGAVRVDRFVLEEPTILLQIDEQGRPNWAFPAAKEPEAEAEAGGEEESPAEPGAPGRGLGELSLDDVRLSRGRVVYADARSGARYELSDVNMALALPDLDSPFKADGSVTWNGEQLRLKAIVERPRNLMGGQATDVEVNVDAKPITLAFAGAVTAAEPLQVSGLTTLNVPSIRQAAAWAGQPIQLEGTGLGPLRIDGKVEVSGKTFAFNDAKLALDDMNATGRFALDTGGAKPQLTARLDVDRLDLNPYLPPPAAEEAGAPAEAPTAEAPAEAPAEWSDEPIDVSALKAANAELALTVGGILVRDVKIGKSALGVTLRDGLLTADLTELQLYEGAGTAKIVIDGRGDVPAIQETLAVNGIQAQPLLTDAAKFDRLEGTGQLQMSVQTRGQSQRAMVEAMNGTGAVKFTDGAIRGVNLAAMVRNVQSAFLDPEARQAQKTDFAELSGTFTITDGIVKNDDLLLLNPLLRLTGKGTVDVPKRTVSYRIEPKAVATLEGQGGEAEKTGLTVPVLVSGPWDNVTWKPDLAGVATGALREPGKIAEQGKQTVEGLKEGITGMFQPKKTQEPAPAPEAGTPETEQDPAEQDQQPAGVEDTVNKLKGMFN